MYKIELFKRELNIKVALRLTLTIIIFNIHNRLEYIKTTQKIV